MKAAQVLRENGLISRDNTLIFDETHIQENDEYVDGGNFGCD